VIHGNPDVAISAACVKPIMPTNNDGMHPVQPLINSLIRANNGEQLEGAWAAPGDRQSVIFNQATTSLLQHSITSVSDLAFFRLSDTFAGLIAENGASRESVHAGRESIR
jgi:broad specificity polyphosphatase/5'/3'-nucleotidase SurE